ncbi:MAG TPA: IS21 family transposase, partial [Nitrolancea sp.]|nr:IS21 family transposase [Nitrolancea sp.]
TRLREERPGLVIGESTVRQYVRERKRTLGLLARETCVPQEYAWGEEAQVDWYEAVAVVDGTPQTWQVFSMRSMASGAAFHRAYPRATQQAFLEAHELAFAYFGGVFRRLRYDNLGAAVQKVLRGHRREETTRFVGFRSHWRYAAEFCTPGEGHEKGGIENEAGTYRRNHWVPIPHVADLAALNAHLLAGCRADEARVLAGRERPVGVALLLEREHLLPLADEGFDLAETSFATVDTLGRVRVRTNAYSVPLPPGTQVQIKVLPATVELWHGGKRVAAHERCYGRGREILDLEHYLDVLEHKPGALAGSKPLAEWRRLGRWPESYDRFLAALVERDGRTAGTKAMIELLQWGRRHGQERLRAAVEHALALGCWDVAAVRHLLSADDLAHHQPPPLAVGDLERFDRPFPTMDAYDQLLAAGDPGRIGVQLGAPEVVR